MVFTLLGWVFVKNQPKKNPGWTFITFSCAVQVRIVICLQLNGTNLFNGALEKLNMRGKILHMNLEQVLAKGVVVCVCVCVCVCVRVCARVCVNDCGSFIIQSYSDADHVILRDLATLNKASEERLNTCVIFNLVCH